MNHLTKVRAINNLNERNLRDGEIKSWHSEYRKSAWIHVSKLDYNLSEGDIIAVFSQYGEIVMIELGRDRKTGESKGFCFLCYEDQRSTVLAVDNLNGIKLVGKTIKVDHVKQFKPPDISKIDKAQLDIYLNGVAPGQKYFVDTYNQNQIRKRNRDDKLSELIG
ncbi:MAG: RNA-binding motif protein, X-linked 2 [Marteilia pararefringens]